MNQETALVNQNTGEIIDAEVTDLVVARPPNKVLEQAREVALALKDRIDNKPKAVKFNGETYLEFEDWQVLGNFYGITAKIIETKYVEYGAVKGFEARAVAVKVGSGQEISGAEALCLNDEPNWAIKPLFQLKSMAQTRACSKALRNVLAWVVVLAGYKPTPAEEMQGVTERPKIAPPSIPQRREPQKLEKLDMDSINSVLNQEPPPWATGEEERREELRPAFGYGKDKPYSALTIDQLYWYKETYEKSIKDEDKARYKAKNQEHLNAVLLAIEDKEGM